jgi:two-component system, OmpR family, sensor histidine kinase KdpD
VTIRGSAAWRALGMSLATVVASLAVTTAAVYVLQDRGGIGDASTLYLLAVAVVAYLRGSWAAIGAAVGAFLTYNFLFLPPRFTFVVSDPQHILTLILLLMVGGGIGWLTGQQRGQAQRSELRERDARALFAVSRAIATAKRTTDALPDLVTRLLADSHMQRIWIALGATWQQEQAVADTARGADLPASGPHSLLRRSADPGQQLWVRLSPPGPPAASRRDSLAVYRLELTDGSTTIGSLSAQRDPRVGPPRDEETRLLAAAADQIGQAIVRDRLAEQATELEVARRSEELKAALLDSVSHDLRTPLATIRATAGTMADPSVPIAPGQARAMAAEIDAEADRLARLVSDLLDMSRIAGGAMQARPEPMPLADVVTPSVERARAALGQRAITLEIPDDLPAVVVDHVLANQVLDNLLDNVARHAAPDAAVRISAVRDSGVVRLRIEDAGPGVPPEAMEHLFEKFYRGPGRRGAARQGTGLGLALVRGLAETMGGSATASKSPLGGLAIDVSMPVAGESPP